MHLIKLDWRKSGQSLMVARSRLAGGSVWRHRRRGAKRWDCLSDWRNRHWLDEWSCRRAYGRTIAARSIPPSPIAVASAELSAGAQAVFLDQVTGASKETCLYHVTTIQARCDYLAPVLRGILDFLLAPPVSFRDICHVGSLL
jgi:hypothetical protein